MGLEVRVDRYDPILTSVTVAHDPGRRGVDQPKQLRSLRRIRRSPVEVRQVVDQLGAMERRKMHIDIGVRKPEVAPIRNIDPFVALTLEQALVSHPRDTEHSAVYVHVVAMLEVIVVRQESR